VPPQIVSHARREDGTASVELIAVVPFLLLAVLVAAQIGVVGYAAWSAGVAARAGARAAVVQGDGVAAARRALPPALRSGARIGDEDGVSVRVVVPRLAPGMPPLSVGAETELGDG
jgi:hypothetical protein